jgi:5-methylcytosine-specific restriction enzyme subunit McrC
MKPAVFRFREHSPQDSDDPVQLSDALAGRVSEYGFGNDEIAKDKTFLALDDTLTAGYVVGLRWIDLPAVTGIARHRGVICVEPKRLGILFDNLLGRCLSDPFVRNHLSDCYRVYPEEPLIPVSEGMADTLGPLLITDFLFRMRIISRKGLKRRFVRRSDSMRARAKGKIDVASTIRLQQKRSSVIDTVCTDESHTVDCTENQILKAALVQAQKYVYRYLHNRSELRRVTAENLFAFEEVSLKPIDVSDLHNVRHSPLFAEYRNAIRLAMIILKWMGMSIESDISRVTTALPPFWINMPELFERYCEVLLRAQYPDSLAGYGYTGYSETRLGRSKMRPDFLIPSENMIVDAKYKFWIEGQRDIDAYRQLSLYARHKKVRELLGGKHDKPPRLQIVFPANQGRDTIDFAGSANRADDEFDNIWKYPIRIDGT